MAACKPKSYVPGTRGPGKVSPRSFVFLRAQARRGTRILTPAPEWCQGRALAKVLPETWRKAACVEKPASGRGRLMGMDPDLGVATFSGAVGFRGPRLQRQGVKTSWLGRLRAGRAAQRLLLQQCR